MLLNDHSYDCSIFEFASPEYDASVKLRYNVLRKPLGLEFDPEDLSTEFDSYHLGCFDRTTEQLIACMILKPIHTDLVKMRQVAVCDQYQSKGVGSHLVAYGEVFIKTKGYNKIELHARHNAISFYKKAGYTTSGSVFKEVGIDHVFMYKNLDNSVM